MPGRVIIPSKKSNELVVLGANGRSPFDFISQLGPTETLTGAVTTCSVYSGVDANPSAVIAAAATISGTQVIQPITNGVLGVIYELQCTVSTSSTPPQTLSLVGYLAIIPDLP